MSDRMPEDLPVRQCINVMVGITRSKVICFVQFLLDVCCQLVGLTRFQQVSQLALFQVLKTVFQDTISKF